MANSDKPQSGKFILYSSPLEFAALLRVIACLPILKLFTTHPTDRKISKKRGYIEYAVTLIVSQVKGEG